MSNFNRRLVWNRLCVGTLASSVTAVVTESRMVLYASRARREAEKQTDQDVEILSDESSDPVARPCRNDMRYANGENCVYVERTFFLLCIFIYVIETFFFSRTSVTLLLWLRLFGCVLLAMQFLHLLGSVNQGRGKRCTCLPLKCFLFDSLVFIGNLEAFLCSVQHLLHLRSQLRHRHCSRVGRAYASSDIANQGLDLNQLVEVEVPLCLHAFEQNPIL